MKRLLPTGLVLAITCLTATALRASAELAYSPDVGVELSGTVVLASEVGYDDEQGSIAIEALDGVLAPGTSIDAFHDAGSSGMLFLPGP